MKFTDYTSEIISPHYSVGGGTIQGHKNPLGSMLTWPHFQYTKADTDYKECYCTFHVSVVSAWISWKSLENYTQEITTEFFGASQVQSFMCYLNVELKSQNQNEKLPFFCQVRIFSNLDRYLIQNGWRCLDREFRTAAGYNQQDMHHLSLCHSCFVQSVTADYSFFFLFNILFCSLVEIRNQWRHLNQFMKMKLSRILLTATTI